MEEMQHFILNTSSAVQLATRRRSNNDANVKLIQLSDFE